MTIVILFILSIVLNLFTIFAIIILYQRQNRLSEFDQTQKQAMKEIEDIFYAYIAELKEENEQFIERFTEIQNKPPMKISNRDSQDVKNEKIPNSYKRMYAAKSYQNTLQHTNESHVESEQVVPEHISDQIIFLQNQGLTIDEIAKKLSKGKTEIDLILKFHQKSTDKLD